MNSVTLRFIGERERSLGKIRTYENDYYKVQLGYLGDIEEDKADGSFGRCYMKVVATAKQPDFQKLFLLPGSEKEEAFCGIEIMEMEFVPYEEIEKRAKMFGIAHATLKEIDTILKKDYPDFYLLSEEKLNMNHEKND